MIPENMLSPAKNDKPVNELVNTYWLADFTGVLLAEMTPLISSNFFATVLAADFRLLRPPSNISLDFLEVRLLGLHTRKYNFFIFTLKFIFEN